MVETFREHMQPAFVSELDAWKLAEFADMPIPPVMIYGDDVTHVLTEEGIANLLLCANTEEREQAIRGERDTPRWDWAGPAHRGESARPGRDPACRGSGIDKRDATRDLLAARSIKDLVRASGGLYHPPVRFRNW